MVHSLTQQVMRQDPVYYALYCALRPDKAWKLISYPYYTKYAQPGDQTYFRHLDVNIPKLLDVGRGANLIQGSVHFDDDDNENCTELLLGFQNHLAEWWDRCVKARGLQTDGYVHKITDRMYTKEDEAYFKTPWTKQLCKRGEVRISMPHLPHGSTGPCTRVWRTTFPWYIMIQEDDESLETLESGSWEDISRSHRDLVAPVVTPSGHPNRYGVIPWRFPGSVELTGISALSDALVGRRRWSSPAALAERDIILGSNQATFDSYIAA